MWSRRSAILVLMAGFLLATVATGARESKVRSKLDPIHVAGATAKRVLSLSASRPVSISIQSPWRSRLKSMLDETDPRVVEESDLGPVLVPIQTIFFRSNGLGPFLRPATLQLRC